MLFFPTKKRDLQNMLDANSSPADPGGDFFIENVMEELDYPGEFFFDTRAQKLYLYHNGAHRRKRRSSIGDYPSSGHSRIAPLNYTTHVAHIIMIKGEHEREQHSMCIVLYV